MNKLTSLAPLPLLRLRVIVYRDKQYDIWVAQCLETGHLVTADDDAAVEVMIIELLHDETTHAVTKQHIANLLSAPAKFDIWKRWLCCHEHTLNEIKDRDEFIAEIDIRKYEG